MNNFSQLEQRPPILVDITKIGLRTSVESRTDFYDMIHEEDLYEIKDQLEAETTDGWIYLVTASHAEGCVNVVCAPELEMELSLMSRWFPKGHDEFKVLASVYAPDRHKAFAQVRDLAASLATEAKNGGETNQWFMITEENAIASLKAAA